MGPQPCRPRENHDTKIMNDDSQISPQTAAPDSNNLGAAPLKGHALIHAQLATLDSAPGVYRMLDA